MLVEYDEVKQNIGEPFRRWFGNEYFDLIVWMESQKIIGFQLCYDIQGYERALTYINGKYQHTGVDQGNESPLSNRSPILVSDGGFEKNKIKKLFREVSQNIDPEVRNYVLNQLNHYGNHV